MSEAEAFKHVQIKHPDKLYIGGQWVAPQAGGRIGIVSPNTEQIVASAAEATEPDMDRAVAAARQAFDQGPWPRMSPQERAERVRDMGRRLRERTLELAHAASQQVGTLFNFAQFMVGSGSDYFESYADLAQTFPFLEQVRPSTGQGVGYKVMQPVGVVAAIAPWNAPYALMTVKVAPALIAGCCVIMKPSPETPLEAYIIAECAEAAGLPPGVINLAPSHREAADYLVRRPGVDKVAFTGSTLAGKRIASVCGERIARVTLELGGKSAAIVLDDYPVEQASAILGNTICALSGQLCATLSRVIVPRAKHDQFAEAISATMRGVKIGESYDPEAQMGPLAMKRQLERVEGYIQKGISEGAALASGGGRPKHLNRGYFIEPTLFASVDNSMTIAQEEIFGPVISLIPSDSVEHAIQIANDSNYGLSGAVFSNDANEVLRIARRMRTGGVGQNALKLDFGLFFGGFKQSGIGREGGPDGILPFLESQLVLMDEPASNVPA